jgi:DNA-binding transcriptional LysR family regulator
MLEIRHFRYFMAVAEERHFRRAAERLGVSQPPLSRQIKELEESLGVTLFQRSSRYVELTAAGRHYYKRVKAALTRLETAGAEAHSIAAGSSGSLAIAFSETAAASGVLVEALRLLRHKHPNIDINLEEATAAVQAKGLRSKKIDITLGYRLPPLRDRHIKSSVIFTDPLLVSIPSSCPAHNRNELKSWLSSHDLFVLPSKDAPDLHERILTGLRSAGVEPRRVREVKRLRSAFTMVACEFGFGVAPRSTTRAPVDGVSFCSLPDFDVCVDTHTFFLQDASNPLMASFIETCTTAGRRYQETNPLVALGGVAGSSTKGAAVSSRRLEPGVVEVVTSLADTGSASQIPRLPRPRDGSMAGAAER